MDFFIFPKHFRRGSAVVGQNEIHHPAADMVYQGFQMVPHRIAGGFPRLGHDVADIKHRGAAFPDGRKDFRHQEIGQHRCVKASRPQGNKVRFPDGLQGIAHGHRRLRHRGHADDTHVPSDFFRIGRNFRFSFHDFAVGHFGPEAHFLGGGRHDLAADIENLAGRFQSVLHAAELLNQGCQEKVSQAVPRQFPFAAEAVLEDLLQHRFLVSQGHQTVPKIPGRNDSHFLPKPSGRAAVIGYGNDGGNIGCFILHSPEQHGQSMAAADGHHPESPGQLHAGQEFLGHFLLVRCQQFHQPLHELPHGGGHNP